MPAGSPIELQAGSPLGPPMSMTSSGVVSHGGLSDEIPEGARILMVEPDPFLREMVEAGIRLYNPTFSLLHAENPESALVMLRRYEIQVVLSEIRFPSAGIRGAELLLQLKEKAPQLPVVLLTNGDNADDFLHLTNVSAVMGKPPDMDQLLRTLNRVVQENRESILRGISLESFLQILEVDRKTCTLTVRSGSRSGRLYIHEGELIHAETSTLQSKAAAFAMLSWPDYTIRITERCDAQPTIAERLNSILMEYCVKKDHGLV